MPQGSCLCGAVRFTVAIPLNPPDACHCTQCRKQSGHYFASTVEPRSALTVTGEDAVRWFQSSEKVRRGFYETCGSTLFGDPIFRDWIGIAMGAFDGPTTTLLGQHIFVSQKGDYYDITDDLPKNQR